MTGRGEPELFIQLEMNSDMIIISDSQRHISQCAPDAELPGQCTVDNERLPARTLHCGITHELTGQLRSNEVLHFILHIFVRDCTDFRIEWL